MVAGLLGAASTTAGIALTVTSGWLIVRASERPVILTLMVAIVAVRAFGMARPGLRYLERLRSHDVALHDLVDRRRDTYLQLVPLTPARLGHRRRSDVLTGVTEDLDDVVQAQVRVTVPLVTAVIAAGVTGLLTALLEPRVGLAIAGLLAAAAAVFTISARRESARQAAFSSGRAEVARIVELVGARGDDLRAVGAQDDALRWLDEAHARLARVASAVGRTRAEAVAQLGLLTGLATLVTAAIVANTSGAAPVKGLLVLAPVAVGEAMVPVIDASRAWVRARGARRRLDGLLSQEPAVVQRGMAQVAVDVDPPLLELRRVCASWCGPGAGARVTSVGPTDLLLLPGSRTLITGANGSGKSTLLAVLARQLDPTAGRYEVDGIDAVTLELDSLRSLFAVVDDEPYVLGTTLRENLRLAGPTASDTHLRASLVRAELGSWSDGLPEGLDTRLGAGGRGMSGGERARLSIARAFVSSRPVILLDEPMAHLDEHTAGQVLRTLLDGADVSTVVVVSHQPLATDRFDQVVVLDAPASSEADARPRQTSAP